MSQILKFRNRKQQIESSLKPRIWVTLQKQMRVPILKFAHLPPHE
ncbi:hypothetical protein HMPREF1861_01650 [Corynebacterium kroppenstedtii]|nr:hypothetical protein HMPREF1861_01650 [Corynebacterium kroppenstedtii]